MNVKATLAFSTIAAATLAVAGCAKNETSASAATAAVAAAHAAAPTAAPAVAEEADDAVAFDDGETLVSAYGKTLTYGEAIANIRRAMKMQGVPDDQLDEVAKQVAPKALPQFAEEFVMLHALRDAAAKAGIVCTDEDVEAEFAEATSHLPPGLTLEEAFERSGITADDLRKQIGETLPVKKLVDDLAKDAKPSDEEIAKFYEENSESFKTPEQVRASHILILADKDDDEKDAEALEKIKAIRERALAGEDFAELAKECSEDPGSKDNGGEYTFGRGRMVPEFEKAAFEQELGVVGEPVRTSYGYHILKVIERIEAGVKTFDEVKDDISKFLANQKKSDIIGEYMKKFRKNLVFEKNEKLAPIFADAEEDDAAEAEPAPAAGAKASACACAECKDPDCDKDDCKCDEPAPAAKHAIETNVVSAPEAESAPASAE